jgi:hypothetical protein
MQKRLFSVLLAIGVFGALAAEAREGFGFTKKAVLMNRTNPPALNIGARRVRVEGTSDRSKESEDAATLRRLTEEMILAGAGTLASDKNAEVTIVLAVDRLNAHESWERRQTYERQKTGEKQVWDDKKKKYKTEDVYTDVQVTKNVKVLDANLEGMYDIEDKSGKVVDSNTLSERFREKYEEGTNAPTPTSIEDRLMKQAATRIASRIVPTTDTVSVLVPKGSFESLIPLAEMNAWDRYLAGVQAVSPKSDPRQEAYRQYALGVAKEGLAYSSERGRAVELLNEAVNHYETAVRSNPGEKIFSQAYSSLLSAGAGAPLPRATASLAAYQAWGTAAGGSSKKGGAVAVAAKSVLTNQRLIDMAKAGLTDENLMLAIDAADAAEFDTTPDGLIALAKGGVSRNVIAHMQKKRKK